MTPKFDIIPGIVMTVEIVCLNELGKPDLTIPGVATGTLQLKRNVDDAVVILNVTGIVVDAAKGSFTFTFTLSSGSADAANAWGMCVADLKVTVSSVNYISELFYVRVRKSTV